MWWYKWYKIRYVGALNFKLTKFHAELLPLHCTGYNSAFSREITAWEVGGWQLTGAEGGYDHREAASLDRAITFKSKIEVILWSCVHGGWVRITTLCSVQTYKSKSVKQDRSKTSTQKSMDTQSKFVRDIILFIKPSTKLKWNIKVE